jgi:hypothetical protein
VAQQTSILGAKQQAHGHIGEDRTSGLLGSYFWLLKRNVDIDGADFLLETVASSIEEERLRRSRITATGVVQAKFFEQGNSVRVRRDYAEEASKPRLEFFLLAHTNGERGRHHHYFLTSQHIAKLPLSEDRKYRVFRVSRTDVHEASRDLAPDTIASVIRDHLARVEDSNNRKFLRSAFFYHRVSHRVVNVAERSTYFLDIFRDTPIVIVESHGSTRLLEVRRDLFRYFGEFTWGYSGTGPSFLTVCILAHHLGGECPSGTQQEIVLEKLISRLDRSQSHVITTDMLEALIGGRIATPLD